MLVLLRPAGRPVTSKRPSGSLESPTRECSHGVAESFGLRAKPALRRVSTKITLSDLRPTAGSALLRGMIGLEAATISWQDVANGSDQEAIALPRSPARISRQLTGHRNSRGSRGDQRHPNEPRRHAGVQSHPEGTMVSPDVSLSGVLREPVSCDPGVMDFGGIRFVSSSKPVEREAAGNSAWNGKLAGVEGRRTVKWVIAGRPLRLRNSLNR